MSNSKLITVTPNKTYATHANAVKAVEKLYPASCTGLHYLVMQQGDRFYPLFVGIRAVEAGVHFNFCVVN